MILQRGLADHLQGFSGRLGLSQADTGFLFAASAFDIHVSQMLCTLAVGGTLVVARPGGHTDPAYMAGVISQAGLWGTCCHLIEGAGKECVLHQRVQTTPSQHSCNGVGEVLNWR